MAATRPRPLVALYLSYRTSAASPALPARGACGVEGEAVMKINAGKLVVNLALNSLVGCGLACLFDEPTGYISAASLAIVALCVAFSIERDRTT